MFHIEWLWVGVSVGRIFVSSFRSHHSGPTAASQRWMQTTPDLCSVGCTQKAIELYFYHYWHFSTQSEAYPSPWQITEFFHSQKILLVFWRDALTEKCIISNKGASEHTPLIDLALTWSKMISSRPIFEIKFKRTGQYVRDHQSPTSSSDSVSNCFLSGRLQQTHHLFKLRPGRITVRNLKAL